MQHIPDTTTFKLYSEPQIKPHGRFMTHSDYVFGLSASSLSCHVTQSHNLLMDLYESKEKREMGVM